MHRKVHVRFGRGEREKDRQRHLARLPTSLGYAQRTPEGPIRGVPELAATTGYQGIAGTFFPRRAGRVVGVRCR